MTTLTDVRAYLKTTLESVSGIGVVHDYERYATRNKELADLYLAGGVLNGWHIRRLARFENEIRHKRFEIDTRWAIRGYYAIDDSAASEKTFDNILEAACEAFRADSTAGGEVTFTSIDANRSGLQIVDSGPVMFAGVLCHAARCEIGTRHHLYGAS